MLTRLRPIASKYLNVIAQNIDLNPNIITLIGLALSFLALIIAVLRIFLPLILVLILLSSFADALDGAVARVKGKASLWGGILDSFCDRIGDAVQLLIPLLLGVNEYIAISALVTSFLVSYLRSLGEKAGIKIEGVGLIERAERLIIVLIALTILIIYGEEGKLMANIIIATLALLSSITVLQRLHYIHKKLKELERGS
jgi:archaetidylinositol phosphate synthase